MHQDTTITFFKNHKPVVIALQKECIWHCFLCVAPFILSWEWFGWKTLRWHVPCIICSSILFFWQIRWWKGVSPRLNVHMVQFVIMSGTVWMIFHWKLVQLRLPLPRRYPEWGLLLRKSRKSVLKTTLKKLGDDEEMLSNGDSLSNESAGVEQKGDNIFKNDDVGFTLTACIMLNWESILS